MADGNDESGASNWWGSWVTSAKAKSSSVLEAVRKDLDELSTAVRTEVSNAGTAIGETFKMDDPTVGQVKKSLSSFFGQVTEALIPSLDDEQDQVEAVLITTDGQITLTGFQKHLAELQTADETYLTPPAASLAENYQRWLEVTEQDQFTQNRLAKHLTSSEILNEKYLALVPDRVAHMDFWQRYLFRRALLEDALANAELAERRARAEAANMAANAPPVTSPTSAQRLVLTEQPKTVLLAGDEEVGDIVEGVEEAVAATPAAAAIALDEADQLEAAFGAGGNGRQRDVDGGAAAAAMWTAETDFASVEISEEEQERLLRAYEEEIQEREMKRSQCVPLEEKLRLEKKHQQQPQAQLINDVPAASSSAPTKSNTKKTTQTQPSKAPSVKSTTATKAADNNKRAQVTAKSTTTKVNASGSKSPANRANSKATPATAVDEKTTEDDAGSDESWVKEFDLVEDDRK